MSTPSSTKISFVRNLPRRTLNGILKPAKVLSSLRRNRSNDGDKAPLIEAIHMQLDYTKASDWQYLPSLETMERGEHLTKVDQPGEVPSSDILRDVILVK